MGTLGKIEEEKKVEEEEECIENEELEENLMDKIKDTVQKMTDGRNSSSKSTIKETTKRRGSKHGLTEESFEATNWIHSIPWYIKPAIPGFFNLLNATLRWFSLIYIAASIAKILFSCSHPCQEEAHCKTIVIYANSKINY